MQPRTRYALGVAAIALLAFALRLVVSFQVAEPSYESYFTLLQADTIHETWLPRFEDPYSYGGRTYAFTPLYHYVMAFPLLLLPDALAVKILPNLFMILLIPLIYLLGHAITKNRQAALIAAFFAGFAPAIFTSGINEATTLSLALPVVAATLLALLELQERPVRALLLLTFLTLLSPLIWLFVFAILLYLAILAAERIRIQGAYLEVALFTFLIASWYTLIIYKDALALHGFGLLTQSLPESVRAATFGQFTPLAMVYAVGLVPLGLAGISLYHATFQQRSQKVLFVASFGLVALLVAAFQLIPLSLALVLLGLLFTVLAAPGYHAALLYLRRTRFAWAPRLVIAAGLLLFILTSLLPAIVAGLYPGSSPTADELDAMAWLRTQPEGSVILAAPKSGFLINREAERRYVADEEYLLIRYPDAVLADIDAVYTGVSAVSVVDLLERYGVTHIIIGPAENERYADFGAILENEECFPRLWRRSRLFILGVRCVVAREGAT